MRTFIYLVLATLALMTLTACSASNYCPAYDGVRQHPYIVKQ